MKRKLLAISLFLIICVSIALPCTTAFAAENYNDGEGTYKVINEATRPALLLAGDSFVAQARVVDSQGKTDGVDQSITYITLKAGRMSIASDITITPFNDGSGRYTVEIGSGVVAGDYVVLARASAYHTDETPVQMGFDICVTENKFKDTITLAEENFFSTSDVFYSKVDNSTAAKGISITNDATNKTVTYETIMEDSNTTYILGGSCFDLYKLYNNTSLTAGKTYCLKGIRIKNLSADGIVPYFGFELSSRTNLSGSTSSVCDVKPVTVSGDNWYEYTGTVTVEKNAQYSSFLSGSKLIIGMPHRSTAVHGSSARRVEGAKILVDTTNISLVEVDKNMFATSDTFYEKVNDTTTAIGISVTSDATNKTVTYETVAEVTNNYNFVLGGSYINLYNLYNNTELKAGETYLLSGIKVKNLSEEGIVPYFGFELSSQLESSGLSTVSDIKPVTVSGDNWYEYSGAVTVEENAFYSSAGGSKLIIGMPHRSVSIRESSARRVEGAKILIDTTNISLVKIKSSHQISNNIANTNVYAGDTISGTAQVTTVKGNSTGVDQNIKITVTDSARKKIVDGFTASQVVNGGYTVQVGENVPAGNYVVVAQNNTNAVAPVLTKGVAITVLEEPIYETEIEREPFGVTIKAAEDISSGKLLFVTYDKNNKMIGFKVVDITVANQESVSLALPVGIEAGDVTRVLLWRDFTNYEPLDEVMIYHQY